MRRLLLACALAACGSSSSPTTADGPVIPPIDGATPDSPTVVTSIPDLRFKWVGAFDSYQLEDIVSFPGGNVKTTHQGDTFGPVTLGSGSGGWSTPLFAPDKVVKPMSSTAQLGPVADYEGFLLGVLPRGVVSAVDFDGVNFAVSATTADDADDTLQSFRAQPTVDGLADYVTTTAQSGEITTAFGLDGDHLEVIGYSVSTDTATYETSVVDADDSALEDQARALAAAGYIITAVGRTALTPPHYALVGTRVAGATTARAAKVTADPTAIGQGFAVVGMVIRNGSPVLILER